MGHKYTPGDHCSASGVYRIYRKTAVGLVATLYLRQVNQGDPFPPTPGSGECFVYEAPIHSSLAA